MIKEPKVLSARKATIALALAAMAVLVAGCVAPFSEMQSARLLGRGNVEVTPSYSSVSASDEGESQHVQDQFGAQAGYGLMGFMDLRLRYEYVRVDLEDESVDVSVLGFGPKFRLVKDWLALYVPVGFAFGSDVDGSESWQVHPTLLGTWAVGKSLEINPSAKIMVPFSGAAGDPLYAFNLGLAISSDVRVWAVRPEIGICTDFEGGHFLHFGVGLTLGPGLFRK